MLIVTRAAEWVDMEERKEMTIEVKKEAVEIEAHRFKEDTVSSCSAVSDTSFETILSSSTPVPGRTSGPTRRSTKGGWTEEEDAILARAVKQYNGRNWKKIAECFPGRKDVQCLHRWQKVINPELIKGTWTKEEDERIIELVNKHGCKKWSIIARSLRGRIGKQCRERWHNHLNPAIKKDAWTTEEEIALIRAHQIYGNKWAEIAKVLPGRADNSIKNHWNCSVKKKLDSYLSSGTLNQPPGSIALDLDNDDTKEEYPKDNVARKTMNSTGLLDQKLRSDVVIKSYSAGLVSENANQGRQCLDVLPIPSGNCKCPRLDINDSLKPLTAAQGDNENPIADGPANLFVRDSADYGNAACHEMSLGHRNDSSLNNSSAHSHHANLQFSPPTSFGNKILYSQMQPYEPIDGKLLESPEGSHRPAFARSDLIVLDKGVVNDNTLTTSAREFTDTDAVDNHRQDPSTPIRSDCGSFGPFCHAHPQVTDLENSVGSGKFSQQETCIKMEHTPVPFSTPPNVSSGISLDAKSPESILRAAAWTFKNTPSIIRKRRRDCLGSSVADSCQREIAILKDSDGACDLVMADSVNNAIGLPCLHQRESSSHAEVGSNDILNVKQLSLKSGDMLKPNFSWAIKSVEKRLEYAFDMEWDAIYRNYRPPVFSPLSANHGASTKFNHFANSNNSREGSKDLSLQFSSLDARVNCNI